LHEGDEARIVLIGTQEGIGKYFHDASVVPDPRVLQPLEHLSPARSAGRKSRRSGCQRRPRPGRSVSSTPHRPRPGHNWQRRPAFVHRCARRGRFPISLAPALHPVGRAEFGLVPVAHSSGRTGLERNRLVHRRLGLVVATQRNEIDQQL
jgi:hypothetical protein